MLQNYHDRVFQALREIDPRFDPSLEANAMKNQADWETGASAYKRPKQK